MRGFIYKRTYTRKRDGKESVLYYAIVEMTKPGAEKRTQDWGRGHHTRREAESDLVGRLKEANEERVTDSKMLLGAYLADHWLPHLGDRVGATTLGAYERATAHIVPRIGHIALRDLKPVHLNQLYIELRESGYLVRYGRDTGQRRPLAPATVRRVHALLSKALNDAIDEELLRVNPARRAKPPRDVPVVEIKVWSAEELTSFLRFVRDDEHYAIWMLAAATGMRRGELAGLQWGDIDLAASTIVVRLSRTTVGSTIITKPPKNGRPRLISVDQLTLATLEELRRSVPWARPNDFIAVGFEGEPLHPDRLSARFARLLRRSGLPRIRFHDLRHTHASLLIRAGVPVKVVTERLGHADPGFTMRVYQHVLPGMQAAAAEAFAELVRDASPERASAMSESPLSTFGRVNHPVNRIEQDGAE